MGEKNVKHHPGIDLSVQWHITTDCTNRCRHCYMFDPATYATERSNTLDRAGLFAVLDRFSEFEQEWDARIDHVTLTGGDPLLRPEWEELTNELNRRGKTVSLMGNPETLTPDRIDALKRLSVENYQLSLDGLAQTHDAIRGPGSFYRTVDGLVRLADAGIRCNVMMTISTENVHELIPLLEYTAQRTRAHSFSFDIASSVGNAGELSGRLSAEILLDLFKRYRQTARRLKDDGHSLKVHEKPALFRVLSALTAGREIVHPEGVTVVGGCLIGWNGVSILADGSVMACRRYPSVVGKLPEQPFSEIFLGSPELRRFRRAGYFEVCGKCRFFGICRGCPAVNFGLTGDPRGAYPLCFKSLLESQEESSLPTKVTLPQLNLPLDATLEEEFALVAGHIHHIAQARMTDNIQDPEYRKALLFFTLDGEKDRFLNDQQKWLAENRIRLGEVDSLCAFLSAERHFKTCPLTEVGGFPCFF